MDAKAAAGSPSLARAERILRTTAAHPERRAALEAKLTALGGARARAGGLADVRGLLFKARAARPCDAARVP